MAASEPYFNKKSYHYKKRILFPGTSCYPLSPHKDNTVSASNVFIEDNDLMFKICQRIPVDLDQSLSFLTDKDQISYMNNIKSSQEVTRSLEDQFIYSSDELVNILK